MKNTIVYFMNLKLYKHSNEILLSEFMIKKEEASEFYRAGKTTSFYDLLFCREPVIS